MNPSFAAVSSRGITVARSRGDGWDVEVALGRPDVRCLAVEPQRDGSIYAGTDGHGVLRSDDQGQTWGETGAGPRHLRSLAASPLVPGRVYAGTRPPGLFVSDDRGDSWREVPALAAARRWYWLTPAEPVTPYVQAIALSPSDPDVMLVGIETGAVLRSENGGRTFSNHCRGAMRDCHTLAFHQLNGDWAYQGGYGGGRVSSDRGRNWRRPPGTGYLKYGWACAADRDDPARWYFSASPGASKAHGGRNAAACLYVSGATGVSAMGGGLPERLAGMPYALVRDPGGTPALYAGLSNGDVWRTDDSGAMWRRLSLSIGPIERTMVAFES